jgi:hypothetical protein
LSVEKASKLRRRRKSPVVGVGEGVEGREEEGEEEGRRRRGRMSDMERRG